MWDVVKTVIVIIKVKSNLSDDDKCSDDNMMIHVFITCTIHVHGLQLCAVGYCTSFIDHLESCGTWESWD